MGHLFGWIEWLAYIIVAIGYSDGNKKNLPELFYLSFTVVLMLGVPLVGLASQSWFY